MSADQRSDCPACGSIRTFREDWDIYGADTGTVTISYRGGCAQCGVTCEFEHDVRFWPMP